MSTKDEALSLAREQGLPETVTEGVFMVNVDDLLRFAKAIDAAAQPVAIEPSGERAELINMLERTAKEITDEGHNGWGNVCLQAAALLSTDAKPASDRSSCCGHASDCAVHNAPAYPAGDCDCGLHPVAVPRGWLCEIKEADFDNCTVTVKMLTSDYRIRAGQYRLSTASDTPQAQPLTDEQNAMIDFLCGACSFDGVWFGDRHPTEKGAFWWRKHLRRVFD